MKKLLSFPKALLLRILQYPWLVMAIAIVFLIGLIWFGGPLVGMESVQSRLTLIVGIILARIVALLLDHYMASRRAGLLEQSLQNQAKDQWLSARPDRREEIAAVRTQFEKGVATLKQSKVGEKGGGAAALYALPWYMFIGPSASGKSTALRHSGLRFPYLGESGKGLQGIGGTRNCDWWFTNDAVLLDTAGRYVTEDEDREEWQAFLDLLKKFRKGKPINGILAAISVADLLQASDEELESHAKKIRSRIDELITRLGIVFPVYLVFTKCDLIKGFVEFFEDLSRAEREQIWGCTFRKAESATEGHSAQFSAEFDELVTSLHARRLSRLASARGPQKLNIYGFPLQFASGREKFARFVELLFLRNPYQENPIFRGFYFTSGTQEGSPIDRILCAVSRASGLSDIVSASSLPSEPKSYFIKNLFTDIIFPDQHLVGPSSTAYRQRDYLRVAVFTAAVLIVLFSVTGLALSFIGNKTLLSSSLSAASNASRIGTQGDGLVEKDIELLDKLGRRLEQLVVYGEKGVPIRLWGLYQGDKIYPSLRDLYLKYFNQIILSPTKHVIEARLKQFVSVDSQEKDDNSDYDYSLLKTYIMLSEPSRMNPVFLEQWLGLLWKARLDGSFERPPSWLEEAGNRQIAFYSRYLAKETGSQFAIDRALVDDVQRKLRHMSPVERLYALIRRESSKNAEPFRLQNVLHGGNQGTLLSDHTVPGIYTYEGWKGSFQVTFDRVLDEYGQESWVIGAPEFRRAELEEGVKKLYFADYVNQWLAFLESVQVRPVVTPADTDEILTILSDANSPLGQVFHVVMKNAGLQHDATKTQEAISGLFEKLKKRIGIESSVDEKLLPTPTNPSSSGFARTVSAKFQSLNTFMFGAKEKTEPPFAQYLAELRKVHQSLRPILKSEGATPDTKAIARSIVAGEPGDLVQAVKTTESLLQRVDPELRERVQPVLLEPLVLAMHGVISRVKTEVNRRWGAEVYQPCQRSIEGRYPFRLVGEDVALTDVAEFFNPQNGTIWRFFQAELKPFIDEGSEQWEAKTWKGIGMKFSPDFLQSLSYARFVSESLFQKGSSDPGVAFEIYPYPPQGRVSSSVSEIRLDVGGQVLRYRMEPQDWYEMKWPGASGALGAVLQVQKGNSWQTQEHKGWWGLFKLLDAGRVTKISDTVYRAQWDFKTQDSNELQVQYDLRARSYKNPFQLGFFSQFRCTPQL